MIACKLLISLPQPRLSYFICYTLSCGCIFINVPSFTSCTNVNFLTTSRNGTTLDPLVIYLLFLKIETTSILPAGSYGCVTWCLRIRKDQTCAEESNLNAGNRVESSNNCIFISFVLSATQKKIFQLLFFFFSSSPATFRAKASHCKDFQTFEFSRG